MNTNTTQSAGFNLKSIKTLSTFELPIKDADGNATGVIFQLAGPTHPARKAVEQARSRRVIQEANLAGRIVLPDPAAAEAERPKELAAQTLGWSGYVDENGTPVPFTSATAQALYAEPELAWLVDQVEAGLGNKRLATKAASAS